MESFTLSVINRFRGGPPTNVGILLHAAEVIAPGVVLVQLPDKSFVVYFDHERWESANKRIWTVDETCPPELVGTNLRVIKLPGLSERSTLTIARVRARGALQSINDDQFFATVQVIDLVDL